MTRPLVERDDISKRQQNDYNIRKGVYKAVQQAKHTFFSHTVAYTDVQLFKQAAVIKVMVQMHPAHPASQSIRREEDKRASRVYITIFSLLIMMLSQTQCNHSSSINLSPLA